PEHQHDPLEEQRLLSLTSNWNFGEPESGFDSDGIPYDSNSPADIANWNARHYNGPIPGISDTSSEEETDKEEEARQLIQYQEIDISSDNQQRHFYGVPANQRDRDYTPKLHTEDHPTLRSDH
ncbi:hypothetical protein CKAH01_19070, partial [Colletotrichum kahawae]